MSELLTYVQLGVRHIIDVEAFDHILFLVALAAIYRFRDARALLWVVTAFTIGHSITLALAATGALALPTALIEFLIPVTIVITGLENIVFNARAPTGRRYRPVFAGVFGLVHGAGFATYLRSLFVDRVAFQRRPGKGTEVVLEKRFEQAGRAGKSGEAVKSMKRRKG